MKIYVKVALFVSINASPSYLSKFAKFFLLNIEALSASLFLLIKEHLKMHVNLQSPFKYRSFICVSVLAH